MNYKALVEHGFERRVAILRGGLAGRLPAGQTFVQSDGTLVVADAIAKIDAYLKLGKAADLAEVASKQARQALLAATPAVYTLTEQLKTLVIAFHGVTNPKLNEFGIKPKHRRKLKPIEEAAAALRRGNTRVIRGTLGPKQRLKLRSPPVKLTPVPKKPDPSAPEGEE